MEGWALLASGNGRKLERFGSALVERPCPQAIWPESGDCRFDEADAVFHRNKDGTGDWAERGRLPARWHARLFDVCFEVRVTGFGNVGLFPEHSVHWEWMSRRLEHIESPAVLNLFGYTGGASIALAGKGVSVTHVDAAKSVNGWAISNAELSGSDRRRMRLIADDVAKFVKREARRRRRYHGIILDPPTFGRGTKGEVWKIERDFYPLLAALQPLLEAAPAFVLVTSHSPGVTPAVLRALLSGWSGCTTAGEMLLMGQGPAIPAGAYARWTP